MSTTNSDIKSDDHHVKNEFTNDGTLTLTNCDYVGPRILTMIMDYLCRHKGDIEYINFDGVYLTDEKVDVICNRVVGTEVNRIRFYNNQLSDKSRQKIKQVMCTRDGFELTLVR